MITLLSLIHLLTLDINDILWSVSMLSLWHYQAVFDDEFENVTKVFELIKWGIANYKLLERFKFLC